MSVLFCFNRVSFDKLHPCVYKIVSSGAVAPGPTCQLCSSCSGVYWAAFDLLTALIYYPDHHNVVVTIGPQSVRLSVRF